jgi:hypothetical protein
MGTPFVSFKVVANVCLVETRKYLSLGIPRLNEGFLSVNEIMVYLLSQNHLLKSPNFLKQIRTVA